MDKRRKPPKWARLTQPLPAPESLQFVVAGQSLNARDHLDVLQAHFAQRPVDAFLHAATLAQFSKAKAERGLALRRSQWQFDNFPAVELPEKLSWAEDPFGDRNWQWQLHSFFVLPPLLAAHAATSDDWFLGRATALVVDWIQANICAGPPCDFTWHDHATALRLTNWLYWFEYARQHGLAPDVLGGFLAAAHLHANVLSEASFYSANNNHGMSQAMALFLAGAALPEFAPAAEWRQLGLERMRAEVGFAFAADGVHVENSPAYHLQVLHNSMLADRACRAYTGTALSAAWEATAAAAADFAAYVTTPDGRVPPVGDSRELRLLDSSRALQKAGVEVSGALLYAATQGQAGTRPEPVDRVFPDSGYALFRDTWRAAADFDQGVYLLFKAGFLSTYHRHDDDLSFILYAYGEDWLIDAGLYRYAERDPLRRFVRSHLAHNVVTVDGVAALRWPASPQRVRLERFQLEAQYASVTGSHELYPGFQTRRRIEYFKPRRFVIHDSVSAADDKLHSFQSLWHLPADKVVELADNTVRVRSRQTEHWLEICFPAGLFEARIIKGQADPDCQGWRSPRYGQIEPAQCLSLLTRAPALTATIELNFH